MTNKDFGNFIQSMTNEEYWHYLDDMSDQDMEGFTNKLLNLSDAELNTYFSLITSEQDVGEDKFLDIGSMSDDEYADFCKSETEKDEYISSSEGPDELWCEDPELEEQEEEKE